MSKIARLSSMSTSSKTSKTNTTQMNKAASHASTSSKASAAKIAADKIRKEIEIPAFSIPPKKKPTESELDKIKRKTIRRNAPPGENLKMIKDIIKSIKGKDVTVQEFIAMVAPSTGDQGATLNAIMKEDLNAFRSLARKVYETVTQDNSDVLLNQQLQLSEFYRERKTILHDRMMRGIDEIYEYAPNFDFDRYHKEGQKYLEEILPVPEDLQLEPEEIEMMKRQAAYHRLQWLRSEGERLNEENNALKRRLGQMKTMLIDEQQKMVEKERLAEAQKEALEAKEQEKQQTLDHLNASLERTIITQEMTMRTKADEDILRPKGSEVDIKFKKNKSKSKIQRRAKWNEIAASEIDKRAIDEMKQGETAKATSPFHYSPPRQEERLDLPAPRPLSPPKTHHSRRSEGPQDTWGGFY